ncbi:ribosomal protein S6--L-glutamate ligase [Streptomyces sp. 2333.5]|uniref:ATP-grasp domain-containing protein n=1 Tax=unclassified Streptomyces TaxID=2593676 RepID=UPI0008991D43|nr:MULTISPECIES: alpha-L-glutamate ligase [unclassified Streptomyces]PJJ03388.1 ribosomal protein S6--L-glutamate ligase [Streptomyces sp. 2333.5]SED44871.1 ribosomal protein S6--L-glutamate ligase [Streptomyces sp. 2314.4]SEE43519.1 ribosomal protein S6--L-glutamate ligase [Streptomyces sp. 2112.2]
MRICLLTADPGHPLLAAVTALLAPEHEVVSLDPGSATAGPALFPLADVYLLKARTPRALALAAFLEEHGAPVLNSAAATARCQDRVAMADVARAAGLPFAATTALTTVGRLAAAGDPATPLVLKSRFSRRHDLVARADSAARLRELAADWAAEPVVVQEFTANSGWDHKLWVVDGRLFAGLRRSELAPGGRGPTRSLPAGELPASWRDAALRAGEVFGLEVYGVDVLDAGGGAPLLVDINAFPGIRGQAGAPEALAELALRTAANGRPTTTGETKLPEVSQK